MATRKAPNDDDEEEAPNKRQRVGGSDVTKPSVDTVSFASLNNDCVVSILSYLSPDDMNSFSICSRHCRVARSHESLDQTRTVTIVWTGRTTLDSFFATFREIRHVFTGNRTCLKIVGFAASRLGEGDLNSSWMELGERLNNAGIRLEAVKTLDCSCPAPVVSQEYDLFYALSEILPNAQKIDFGNIYSREGYLIASFFARKCSELNNVSWKNGCQLLSPCGFDLREATNLKYLNMDGVLLHPSYVFPCDSYLFNECTHLERLSLKDATQCGERFHDEPLAISQEMLIKMIRRHPALRWLRSDLADENVAMLKRERPDITFVSE